MGAAAECLGHPAGPFDPLGEAVYCDGSCRGPRTSVRPSAGPASARFVLRGSRLGEAITPVPVAGHAGAAIVAARGLLAAGAACVVTVWASRGGIVAVVARC